MYTLLTHYTDSFEAILGIISHGFAWVPNERGLISDLVPDHEFDEREPQQFGMISFTELNPSDAARNRQKFGEFGISVSKAWAEKHEAQKVLYVDRKGPVFEAFKRLFQAAYGQLEQNIDFPDDAALRMAFTNKQMAGVTGGILWAHLLQIYEYLEPIENAYQQEWRIVHPYPYYGYPQSKTDIIKAVSPPKGWAQHFNVVPLECEDVVRIICPKSCCDRLRKNLPKLYRDAPLECLSEVP